MPTDLRDVEERLGWLLSQCSGHLPEQDLTRVRELMSAGEPRIALEHFWTQLTKRYGIVPSDVAVEVVNLSEVLGANLHSPS
jgi:hypothetical protein